MIERLCDLFWCAVVSVAVAVAIIAITNVVWLIVKEKQADFISVDMAYCEEISIIDIPRTFNGIKLRAYSKEDVPDVNDLVHVGNGLYVIDDPAYVLDYIDFWHK